MKKKTAKLSRPSRKAAARATPRKASTAQARATAGLKSAAKATRTAVKEHPFAAAAAMLGAGLLAGVAADRALRKKPTVGGVLMDALNSRAATASRAISAVAKTGMAVAARKARRALK